MIVLKHKLERSRRGAGQFQPFLRVCAEFYLKFAQLGWNSAVSYQIVWKDQYFLFQFARVGLCAFEVGFASFRFVHAMQLFQITYLFVLLAIEYSDFVHFDLFT